MNGSFARIGARVSAALATGAALSIVAPPAVAAPAEVRPPGSGEFLATVVVDATPLPGAGIDRADVPAPVQTATADDLERTRALDLSAFMNRTLGSVYVNEVQNNPLQPDVNYRGYTASPLLGTPQGLSVYLDGVRLNQPFGDVVSWDLIPREAIATLTLMPGSNPLFGLNTLGGALALATKDGIAAPGYAVELNHGSERRRRAAVEAGGDASNGLHWYATANELRDDGWRAESPTAARQAFGKLGWRRGATGLALSGAYADTDLNGNGLQDLELLQRDYASVYTKPDNTRNEAFLVNLVATHAPNDVLALSGNAYHRAIDTDTYNGDINDDSLGESLYQPTAEEQDALAAAGYTGFPTAGETQANTPYPRWRCIANVLLNDEPNEKCNGLANRTRTRQHESGIALQATFTAALAGRANRLTVGAAHVRSRARFVQSSQFGHLAPDRGVVPVAGPGAFADGTQASEDAIDARVELAGRTHTTSVYFTDTLQVLPVAHLTVSGRFDRSDVETADAITPGGGPGSLDGRHHFARFNPALGLTLAPSDAWNAYAGYTEGSRAPSAIELGCADPENPCRLPNAMAGDPPLDPVVTRTLELGVRGRAGDVVAWSAGVFRAVNRDDIMFVADDTSGFGYFRNFGKTRRQGAELGMTARVGAFDLGANYTFLDATYRSAEEVLGEGNSTNEEGPGLEGTIDVRPGDRIPLTPRHVFKAHATWRVSPRFTASVDAIAIGGSHARGNENNAHAPDGTYYLGPGRTGGYAVVNVGVDYEPLPSLTLYAQVSNALDREYATASQLGSTGFDASGRFVARPFDGPVVDGELPLRGSTFVAPGAPRAYWIGVRWAFGAREGAAVR